jgi:hypothetical protein
VGWTLGLRIPLFFFKRESIETVINAGEQLLEASQLSLLIQHHGVERFEVALQMHQQRLKMF